MNDTLHAILAALVGYFGFYIVPLADAEPAKPPAKPEPANTDVVIVKRHRPRRRKPGDNRVTYRQTAINGKPGSKGRAAIVTARAKTIAALLPMEKTVWAYVAAHPAESARQIAAATNMNGKTVESALYRLRRLHGLVESVGERGDVTK